MRFPLMNVSSGVIQPWNDWYHFMGHTYGTWLPGDPKGFRTRHHREHVEGDYKHPPLKGEYDHRWERAKKLMKRDPVYLDEQQRERAVQEFVRCFQKRGINLRILSIDRIHLHGLGKFIDHNPRHYVGIAKKESSAYMKRDGLAPVGGLWAVRCKCVPVEDGRHYFNTIDYLRAHVEKCAYLYDNLEIDQMSSFDPNGLLLE